jgi:hypothetical protein
MVEVADWPESTDSAEGEAEIRKPTIVKLTITVLVIAELPFVAVTVTL